MSFSQNGWPVVTSSSDGRLVSFPWVTGRVRAGDVFTVLNYVAERWDAEVEPIRRDWSWGWAFRAIRGSATTSNHASGTAVDFNAPKHPLGVRGTFTERQINALRHISNDLEGTIRFGEFYQNRVDGMHVEVNCTPQMLANIAGKIRAGLLPGLREDDDMPRYTEWDEKDRAALLSDIKSVIKSDDVRQYIINADLSPNNPNKKDTVRNALRKVIRSRRV